jgi:hypothetical protein
MEAGTIIVLIVLPLTISFLVGMRAASRRPSERVFAKQKCSGRRDWVS